MEHRPCRECKTVISTEAETCPHCGTLEPTRETAATDDKSQIRKWLDDAKREYDEFGGWRGFTNGQWLWLLIQKSFKNYWERATAEYFHAKYPGLDVDKIAKRLITVAAKNASIVGAITGAAISTDEIVGIVTLAEGSVGLPANLAIGAAAIGGEVVLLLRIQLQLVANLGKLYGAPLDPDDPEDILTILAFAAGGAGSEAAGKAGMKIGGVAAGRAAKSIFSKETLTLLKNIAGKVGVKILQRSIVKYTVPVASIGIGTGWNYIATRAVGRLAIKHFKQRLIPAEQP